MAYFWFMFFMLCFIIIPVLFLVAAILTVAYMAVSDWVKGKVKR